MEDRIILGIDNSLDFLNIVIASDNRIIEERRIGNMRIPSGVIGTEVSEMLSSNNFTFENVRAIIVTLGPGSFTGIRVALAFCKGIASGMNVPITGIPTLDVLASPFSFMENHFLCPLIDAKKNEVFCSLYFVTHGKIERIREYTAIKPEHIKEFVNMPCICFGTGVNVCEKHLLDIGKSIIIDKGYSKNITGEAIIKEGLKKSSSMSAMTDSLMPIYGRRSEAEIKFNVSLT
ncbi:MAG TPA: tRNA (adenosine(37)-N6)-threonylcarbamoyltransferase complex dimerization subunit type 1 TsaB [Syntrophorhabdaceae bacterium]|jgi:tRNA threonylcarbamoyladenosine biosynthesis protein TsaB|nr:tRNA (adenosine(37)-N6)-threonylcarbamoyltransferase complex dimerization subunit type 1 TsaB [Syntrophorhabdaceae bacterium]MDI9560915.1 tRNA (adenosine(37)-N6)-threonylcarbamoyltransferase complex dimerization subunit type 1 TsaB [Pseudomonadota bacterium]OQC47416.1 MAG: tRNA threonylcarbamoyladenosine biosynthesis protein TsaB [Deltaproteobacteria bacterium ADurb.Bin026]MBP8697811.1 tRNA (adenosine(37)-N6)-threonylcarbamoyltransferase complex dimerization subunit type 1 TsaB [Syntrophorhab